MTSMASMPVYMMPGVSVVQPSHLEGDASLATEILPGPPSLVSAQQFAHKRDPRKLSAPFSYLPPSDPGSTYSGLMAGTLVGQEVEGPRTKRTRVDKGTTTGRAQRASARNQNGATSAPDPPAHNEVGSTSVAQAIPSDSDFTMIVDDEPSLSRSNSSLNLQEGGSTSANGRMRSRRDKGKAKETELPVVRVKEEPKTISLHSPEPPVSLINNEDHCSSCRSQGALVYCDGCPRAFHFWCLDPPMESVDEGDSRWFCPSCTIRKNPPRKPPSSFMSPLIYHVETNIPTEFQLPDDVRTFFKDVATGPKGAYVDSSEIKQPRLNRHGQLEDRDAYRLRDRNGAPVLCFRCGMSALPGGLAAATPATKRARRSLSKETTPETWKSIVSCDHCSLHWHLDCLDPPLVTMPTFSKKWMCPNHAEQITHPKRRIPKQNVPLIEITKPKQFNNGNIEIIHPETASSSQNKVAVDEVLINGRRYRVPERVIMLDFWSKISKSAGSGDRESVPGSPMSSPLTSLSSLEDLDEGMPPISEPSLFSVEDLRVAQMLCSLRSAQTPSPPKLPGGTQNGTRRHINHTGVQTEAVDHLELRPVRSKVVKTSKSSASTKRTSNRVASVNGQGRTLLNDSITAHAGPSTSTAKRKKSMSSIQAEPSTRELRSRSKNNDLSTNSISKHNFSMRLDDASRGNLTHDGSMSAPLLPPSFAKSKPTYIKIEDSDNSHALLNGLSQEAGSSSTKTPSKALPPNSGKRNRNTRRPAQKESDVTEREEREKRGKKRKEREDEVLDHDEKHRGEAIEKANKEKKEKEKRELEGKKAIRTPNRQGHVPPATAATSVPVSSAPHAPALTSAPTTPSLKIRLPRLSNLNRHPNSSTAIPTSQPTGINANSPAHP